MCHYRLPYNMFCIFVIVYRAMQLYCIHTAGCSLDLLSYLRLQVPPDGKCGRLHFMEGVCVCVSTV